MSKNSYLVKSFCKRRIRCVSLSLSTPYARLVFFWIPVAAAEHRSPPRGCRETFDRARGAYFAPGELGERWGGREAQGESRRLRGVLSFGSFSLHEQRKGIQGAGAEPPASNMPPKAARQMCSPFDKPVLSRSHFDKLSANGRRAQGERLIGPPHPNLLPEGEGISAIYAN